MTTRTRIVELNEEKIDHLASKDFWFFDARPCDLEGDDLGVHTWLKLKITYEGNQIVADEVIDCDRKDEK